MWLEGLLLFKGVIDYPSEKSIINYFLKRKSSPKNLHILKLPIILERMRES